MSLVSTQFAQEFAEEWIAGWNAGDLGRVMRNYAEEVELSSPGIIGTAGEDSGMLRGKARVMAYREKALMAAPDLRFELLGVYAGIRSVTIHYRSVGRRVVTDVLEFNANGQVVRESAQWRIE